MDMAALFKKRCSVYGVSAEFLADLLREQDGRCAICMKPFVKTPRGKPVVDHDHKTGKVRGLLCDHCNAGLGLFKDNARLLLAAVHYLAGSE